MLLRLNNVNKVDFSYIPFIWVSSLNILMLSFWDVMMVRNPVVFRFVLLFWSLSLWIQP